MWQRYWRQAAAVGLAFVLLFALARNAWTTAQAVRAQATLNDAGRWLRGRVIVVDPGHGGFDPGAVVEGTEEKQIVLDISLALKKALEEQGAKVILTRDEDEDLAKRIREDLEKRVALIRQHKAHVYVSVHANKDRCLCWGAQTFYQRNGMPAGKELAFAVQNQLRKLTPTTRTALPADYFVLRTSPVPAVMVETGFLTYAKERQRLQDPSYQRTVATAIAIGLAEFFRSQVPEGKAGGSMGR